MPEFIYLDESYNWFMREHVYVDNGLSLTLCEECAADLNLEPIKDVINMRLIGNYPTPYSCSRVHISFDIGTAIQKKGIHGSFRCIKTAKYIIDLNHLTEIEYLRYMDG